MAGDTSGRIFISYRREDTKYAALPLHDRLKAHFEVFRDVASMDPGVDFGEAIDRAVSRCDVLLALIGPAWMTAVEKRQSDAPSEDSEDWAALEVRSALDRGIRVIPVLVDGAAMPRPDELPEALKPLARRHAIRLDYETFDTQVDQLIAKLKLILAAGAAEPALSERLPGDAVPTPAHGVPDVPGNEPLPPPPADTPPAAPETRPGPVPAARRRTVALAAIGLLVLGLVGALILLWPDSGSNGGGAVTTTVTTVIGVRDRLESGDRLGPGAFIASADGRHRLEMTAGGSLLLTTNGVTQWAPDRQGPPGSWAILQDTDGNFVVYPPTGPFVWASGTTSDPGSYLVVEDREGEARITIYAPDGRDLWHRPVSDGPEPNTTSVESTAATTATTAPSSTLPETSVTGTAVPLSTP